MGRQIDGCTKPFIVIVCQIVQQSGAQKLENGGVYNIRLWTSFWSQKDLASTAPRGAQVRYPTTDAMRGGSRTGEGLRALSWSNVPIPLPSCCLGLVHDCFLR